MTDVRGDHRKVIVFSGHMIDGPGRSDPRFPHTKEKAAREAIELKLVEWGINQDDLGICGGACGGDIIFAEVCLAHGCSIKLMIGAHMDLFLERSVRIGGLSWADRFQTLRENPRCETLVRERTTLQTVSINSEFEESNLWIWSTALQAAYPKAPYTLVLWDEKPYGEGAGGTSHFVSLVIGGKYSFSVINPSLIVS